MLELREITKDYQVGEDKVHALKGISLAFRESEFVSILGQSGCGKTTLLNIIGGLDRYTGGRLYIDGRSTEYFKPSDWDAYRNQKIGFVFQSYNLIPHLTVLGNVELALTLSGVKKAERVARAEQALRTVGLEGEMRKRPNQLSGGQMQRVAIARALINNPEIILADEPTGALDSETSVAVMDLLKEISREKLVIMVTHNRELAETYSTRIISMLDGKIVSDTSPVEFAEHDQIKQVEPQSAEQLKKTKAEQKAITKANRAALKRTSMSVWTAFSLSLSNLITKKGRTIATAIAGSIGIIGVALVLALSNGFNGYIADMQTSMLSNYPVTVTQLSMDVNALMDSYENRVVLEKFPDGNKIIIKDPYVPPMYRFNRITDEYVQKVKSIPKDKIIDVTFDYAHKPIIMSEYMTAHGGYDVIKTSTNGMAAAVGASSSGFQQLMSNTEYVLSQYDVFGAYPQAANEIALVIGTDNSINETVLKDLGMPIPEDRDTVTYDTYIGKTLKLVHNNEWFSLGEGGYYTGFDKLSHADGDWKALYDNPNNTTLTVTGIMRLKESASLAMYGTGIVCTPLLNSEFIADCMKSDVAVAQQTNREKCMSDAFVFSMGNSGAMTFGGMSLDFVYNQLSRMANLAGIDNISKNDVLLMFNQAVGGSDIPTGLTMYPVTFSKKGDMISYVNGYNEGKSKADSVFVMDAASLVTDSVGDMIDIISYVLVAFAAISLLVSSVMISIITYASVSERIKEIGVLRSVGARKGDIMRVFIAETVLIGFAAGVIGVLITLILSFPLSSVFIAISDGAVNSALVVVAWWHALLLIFISMLLTFFAGMLPARSASKRDPVIALRTE